MKNSLSLFEAVSTYPSLLNQEENVAKNPFDVSSWLIYLDEIDDLVSSIANSTLKSDRRPTQQPAFAGYGNDNERTRKEQELRHFRDICGRRALKHLPKSYKLWRRHWDYIIQQHQKQNEKEEYFSYKKVIQMFEHALITLHKFPRVWIAYLHFMHESGGKNNVSNPTRLRRLANRALEALPVTQHDKIWPILLRFYQKQNPVTEPLSEPEAYQMFPDESKVCMLRRYLEFNPMATREVADFFANKLGKWGEAALLYQKLLNGTSSAGVETTLTSTQRQELWMSLADVCKQHPQQMDELGINWELMVRAVLANPKRFRLLQEEIPQGVLWNQLADSWIRRGEFQLARSVYEEAMESVSHVRDFHILLDAYLRFEEGLLEALMENQAIDDDNEIENNAKTSASADETDQDWDILLSKQGDASTEGNHDLSSESFPSEIPSTTMSLSDLELALARAENLTARRPLLLNRVLLRQNPHDIGEWLKRSTLYEANEQPEMAASALEEALQTVQAHRATGGSPSQLVTRLVAIYDSGNEIASANGEPKQNSEGSAVLNGLTRARNLLDRVCNQGIFDFHKVDDLAECYATWVELELRHERWDEALSICRQSVIGSLAQNSIHKEGGKQVRKTGMAKTVRGLRKSQRLWDLLLDLEESLGTVQTAKDAYNRAIEMHVATPMHILNFATFLSEHSFFEEAFTTYERGVELFEFPSVKIIWKAYLEAFLERYKGTKVERARDLFERCLEACPPDLCSSFFMMFGEFEEKYSLTKHRALQVYRRMCSTVEKSEKYMAYQLWIAKTTNYLGLTATREIYQLAVEDSSLHDGDAAQLCLDFAAMEASLQEIDRARAVLTYGSQLADPRRNEHYWNTWKEFEISHGNEETFREMLRTKRSVEGAFSTVNYNAAEMSSTSNKVDTLSNEQAMHMIAKREGVELAESFDQNSEGAQQTLSGKRVAKMANLDDVESRVAKLRRATAASDATRQRSEALQEEDDDNEIDLVDSGAPPDDAAHQTTENPLPSDTALNGVSTKTVPASVFGGLVAEEDKS